MYRLQKFHDVRCCIGTIGNAHGLSLTLQSVISQSMVPGSIAIYDCSQTGIGKDFYIQQLIQCAVLIGIRVEVISLGKVPLDEMYDLMLEESVHRMWLCNDDVLYDPWCLEALDDASESHGLVAVCGSKPDIVNQRQYADWSKDYRTSVKDGDPPYAFYKLGLTAPKAVTRIHLDLGNTLMHVRPIKDAGIKFKIDEESSATSFGEDWVWAAKMQKAKLKTGFAPNAQAIHLDKPSGSPFNPYTTQRQLLEERLRAKDLPTDVLAEWGAS
jgi:hypothetical protein